MDRLSDDDLRWLLELVEQEGLLEIEVSSGDVEACVRAAGAGSVAAAPAGPPVEPASPALPEAENVERLLSPMAGIFYRSPSPEAPPYAEPGDEVHVGDTVGLIEAMKLYNEVTTHVHGRIVQFLAGNEQHIDADQPLALIERFYM